jgi:hypothetical protein
MARSDLESSGMICEMCESTLSSHASFYIKQHSASMIPAISPSFKEATTECALDRKHSSAWTLHAASTDTKLSILMGLVLSSCSVTNGTKWFGVQWDDLWDVWVHIIVTSPCDLFALGLKQVFNIIIYWSVGPLTTRYTDCMFILMTVLAASITL